MTFLALFLGGFFAGITNSLTGGGSVVSLPILMALGFSAAPAIATNRFSVIFLSLAASRSFHAGGHFEKKEAVKLAALTGFGGALGAIITANLSERPLDIAIFSIFLVFAIFLFAPRRSPEAETSSQGDGLLPLLAVFLLGIYGGFIGVAVSTMTVILYKRAFGWSSLKSLGVNQLGVFTLSVTASAVFIWKGLVEWQAALFLGSGMAAGGHWGPRLAEKIGERKLEFLIKAMTLYFLMKLGAKVLLF